MGVNLKGEFFLDALLRFSYAFRIHGHADRMLRTSLRDQDNADVFPCQSSEQSVGNPGHTDHPAPLDSEQGYRIYGGYTLDRSVRSRPGYHKSA